MIKGVTFIAVRISLLREEIEQIRTQKFLDEGL